MSRWPGCTVALCLFWAGAATAQERPDEDALFGAPAPSEAETPADPAPAATEAPAAPADAPTEAEDRDAQMLSGPAVESQFDTGEMKDDPLTLGGFVYSRFLANVRERDTAAAVPLSAPTLVSAYLDARPSGDVRAMLIARMNYDPTLDSAGSAGLVPQLVTTAASNPAVLLDQLWIRFTIADSVFVTAGKQQVRWGASRFWNPNDYLTPRRRDPLAVFDDRLGANIIKVHVPWEERGWNFYAYGLLDNAGAANTLGEVGGALRAELVFGSTEVALGAIAVRGQRPRYALDFSSALGPFDVYGEVSLRSGRDFPQWRTVGSGFSTANPSPAAFERYTLRSPQVLTSGGLTYSFNYTSNQLVTLGAEYFYNPVGYSDAELYPWLLFQGEFRPFYLGRHYAGLYAVAPGLPWNLDNWTLVLSHLANVSDVSMITRLDVLIRALTFLNLEFFAAVNSGNRGGEFKFALDLPPLDLGNGVTTPPISVPAPEASFGVSMRVNL